MISIDSMELMNSTTITISHRTRRELLKVAADLQSQRGKKIDYEDVIEYLIATARRRPELLKIATAPKGVPSAELQKLLREGRAEDRRHEEALERRYS